MSSALSSERTFPYDALDHILSYACEGSPARALALGTTCRYWLSRFHDGEPLWTTIATSSTTKTASIPRSLRTYEGVRSAYEKSAQLRPIDSATLHPIEDCTLEFRCPMYAENLKYVGPGESFCDVCKQSVYLVRTQQELNDRASKGHCVMMRPQDIVLGAVDDTITRIAIVFANECDIERGMKIVAQPAESSRFDRTGHIFPVVGIREKSRRYPTLVFEALSADQVAEMPEDQTRFSFAILGNVDDAKGSAFFDNMARNGAVDRRGMGNFADILKDVIERFTPQRREVRGMRRRLT